MNFNEYLKARFTVGSRNITEKSKKKGISTIIVFFFFGVVASIWVLFRLIPKPSRSTYPCMKVAFPVATSFLIYITGMVGSVYFFKTAGRKIKERKLLIAMSFIFIAFLTLSISLLNNKETSSANIKSTFRFEDPLGPNNPIGEAKGVLPGRVVWVHNPDATNINCTNLNQSDAYWLAKNCDQATVDQMFSEGIRKISGKESHAEAWNAIFRYFNNNHGKGDVGYQSDETIFIKVNAVTAYNGATANGGKQPASQAIEYDTTPQAILSMLRHLINDAGVPQKNIYVGDPLADLWDHMYQYFHAEFPDVNYVSKRNISNRYKLTASTTVGINYSDRGKVMNELQGHTHKFFKEMMDADYLINIPVMKGHRWGGVTLCAKNHFGSNTSDGSWQLHKGLMNPDNNGMRNDYKSYRVFVDLMGSKYLGGNTLIYFVDALWSTSYEHQRPQKFQSAPFNNDWCSSILISLDPVAIESVCIDLLQKEFTEEEIIDGTNGTATDRFVFVQWEGIDDYLHQAASSDWWPEGITYDPENDGTPIGSLGVHEHWNNVNDMKYSRNLGTGNGIDLVMIEQKANDVQILAEKTDFTIDVYPNPVTDYATLKMKTDFTGEVEINVFSSNGKQIESFHFQKMATIGETTIDLSGFVKGNYIVRLQSGNQIYSTQIIKN